MKQNDWNKTTLTRKLLEQFIIFEWFFERCLLLVCWEEEEQALKLRRDDSLLFFSPIFPPNDKGTWRLLLLKSSVWCDIHLKMMLLCLFKTGNSSFKRSFILQQQQASLIVEQFDKTFWVKDIQKRRKNFISIYNGKPICLIQLLQWWGIKLIWFSPTITCIIQWNSIHKEACVIQAKATKHVHKSLKYGGKDINVYIYLSLHDFVIFDL